jgi:uridine kinase
MTGVSERAAARVASRIQEIVDRHSHAVIAIDGRCASGKSTLARTLGQQFGAPVIPMDHFFLRPEQRTPKRLAVPGANVDHERFKDEVLNSLLGGSAFSYRPFDCRTNDFAYPVAIPAARLRIVEGSYALHPQLADGYAYRVFLTVDPSTQLRRLADRNPALLERFKTEWIPLEERYFALFDIADSADHIIDTSPIHAGV